MLILLLFLVLPAWAGDQEEVRRLIEPGNRVDSLRLKENWALASETYARGEGGGMELFRKVDGKWLYVGGGGGALGPHELYQMGVPRRLWSELLNWQVPKKDVEEALNSGPGWPELSQRVMTADDLEYHSGYELTLMRNEIFARHGRIFKDPLLAEYFGSRRWYKPRRDFNEKSLTAVERRNVQAIMQYQNSHGKNF